MLIEFFGNYPRIRVMDLLISNPNTEYTKTDIAECADISRKTLYDFFKKLEEYNLIKPTSKYGNTQLFKVDTNSPAVKALNAFQIRLAEIEIDKEMKEYEIQEETDEELDLENIYDYVDKIVENEIVEREFRINKFESSSNGDSYLSIAPSTRVSLFPNWIGD